MCLDQGKWVNKPSVHYSIKLIPIYRQVGSNPPQVPAAFLH